VAKLSTLDAHRILVFGSSFGLWSCPPKWSCFLRVLDLLATFQFEKCLVIHALGKLVKTVLKEMPLMIKGSVSVTKHKSR
jgi:hypothetical protein